jgi:hypothetical protein
MYPTLRQKLIIQPGGVIEIRSPELPDGEMAEVTVRLVLPRRSRPAAASQARARKPEDLGWPPGFFAETYGSLRDLPLVREPQGDYAVRDELQ